MFNKMGGVCPPIHYRIKTVIFHKIIEIKNLTFIYLLAHKRPSLDRGAKELVTFSFLLLVLQLSVCVCVCVCVHASLFSITVGIWGIKQKGTTSNPYELRT